MATVETGDVIFQPPCNLIFDFAFITFSYHFPSISFTPISVLFV